ncbi:MAG: histidine--tRNA ligase, partial [Terriglobales bacterium]
MPVHAIKGMRDLLPADTIWFQRLEAAVREVFALYNFDEIRTPLLEPDELFRRAVGEETDIVGKEMYSFADRDGAQLTLRPEATASTVRAYVEHRLWERPGQCKLYYMGPMFRRERPQKGRYRQFYQVGAEVLGGDEPWIDCELLVMLQRLLARCGIRGAELVLNSVGCADDRPRYHEALRAALADKLPQMCADCQRRAQTNPLRVLDCKVAADQPIINALPTMQDFLDDKCRAHFDELCRLLDAAG